MSGSRSPKGTGKIEAARRALGDRRATPDPIWVARLTGASRREVDETLAEVGDLVEIEAEIRAAHRAAGRPGYAQIRAPFELYALARLLRPDHVVELGVSSGVSSAHFLLALARNRHGRLHSIDWPTPQRGPVLATNESSVAIPPGRSSGWAIPEHLRAGWDLRIGRSQDRLPPLIDDLPSLGLFLHDDLHTPAHLAWELETVRPRISPGAVLLADNTAWTGASFPRFARALGVAWYRRRRSDLVGLKAPDDLTAPRPRPTRVRR
ncbi:MAG: class I SAM-dependent methyltransferase [Thermoplasmata archaeon]